MSTGALSVGIDLGTGSVKAVALDETGVQVGAGAASAGPTEPQPGWAESSPEQWWAAAKSAVEGALAGNSARVGAIGLSGQMHGVVLCSEDGEPLRPAIISLDRRALADLDAYRAMGPELLLALGNPLVPGMAGPLLHWLARHEPALVRRAAWALQPKDWLRLRLTGKAGSEPSDASGTLLFHLGANTWAWEVVDALGLPRPLLAPLGEAGWPAGSLTETAASWLGLPAGVPVAYGAADTAAALIGTALPRGGAVQLTVGSAAQVVTLREKPVPSPELSYHVFASAEPGLWYALAAVQIAGVALSWALRAFACSWEEAYSALEVAPVGARGVRFVPHLAGARSPSMDSTATGGFSGLELAHGREDLIRAVFEGVAFSIAEAASCLPELDEATSLYLAGGGTLRRPWRQLLSDVLGKALLVVDDPNASARGAALLGLRAAGVTSPLASGPTVAEKVEPEPEAYQRLAESFEQWKTSAQKMNQFSGLPS